MREEISGETVKMETKTKELPLEQMTRYFQYEKPSHIIATMFWTAHGQGNYLGIENRLNFWDIYDHRSIGLFNSLCNTNLPLDVSTNNLKLFRYANPEEYPDPSIIRSEQKYLSTLDYESKRPNPILDVPIGYQFDFDKAFYDYNSNRRLERLVGFCEALKQNKRKFIGDYQTDSSNPFEISKELYSLLKEDKDRFVALLNLFRVETPDYESAREELSKRNQNAKVITEEMDLLGRLRNSIANLNIFYHANLSHFPPWFTKVFFKDCRDYKNHEVHACFLWAEKHDPKVPIELKKPLSGQIVRTHSKIQDLLELWRETQDAASEEMIKDRDEFYEELVRFFTVIR